MDRLTLFLTQFPVAADVFHNGVLPGSAGYLEEDQLGHLHVFRSGRFYVNLDGKPGMEISEPTLLFCPKPVRHLLQSSDDTVGEVLCATVSLGETANNPVVDSLPDVIVLPLAQIPSLDQVLSLLFDEAAGDRCGKQVAQNRLVEYFLVLLLRELIDRNAVDSGLLAGLADKRLAKVVTAVQAAPEKPWLLEDMAAVAGMSRARFAAHFNNVLNMTPHRFLTDWRISLTQQRLRRGESLQKFYLEVGYSQPAVLIRAFQQRLGVTPRAWLKSLE